MVLLENKLALANKKLEIANNEKAEKMESEQMLSEQIDELNAIIREQESSNAGLQNQVDSLIKEKQYWQSDNDDFRVKQIELESRLGLEEEKYKDAHEQLQNHLSQD